MATAPSEKKSNALKARVEAAINKIVAEGGKPTQAKIVGITGGSLRDYSPVIREVMAEMATREAAARSIPEMPEEIADMAVEIWGVAYRAADELAAAERKSHIEQSALTGFADERDLENVEERGKDRDDVDPHVSSRRCRRPTPRGTCPTPRPARDPRRGFLRTARPGA